MDTSTYKSPYVWPDEIFPFRHYYKNQNLDIFIIENIMHNYTWLKQYANYISDKHFFFVICGWFHDNWFVKTYSEIFDVLKLKRDNFFFLCNSQIEKEKLEKNGFIGSVINNNCWLDENIIPCFEVEKLYDAILVARMSKFKRHYLANRVKKLALICGGINHKKDIEYQIPKATLKLDIPISESEVFNLINKSRCGLMLSESEGACFSSSEYLLCGIPVVSTRSVGGRDFWYNSYNSIVCEPDECSVLNAVNFFIDNPRDSHKIRQDHINLSLQQRQLFIKILQNIFDKYNIKQNADQYFKQNFFHKMRTSITPNFQEIFI